MSNSACFQFRIHELLHVVLGVFPFSLYITWADPLPPPPFLSQFFSSTNSSLAPIKIQNLLARTRILPRKILQRKRTRPSLEAMAKRIPAPSPFSPAPAFRRPRPIHHLPLLRKTIQMPGLFRRTTILITRHKPRLLLLLLPLIHNNLLRPNRGVLSQMPLKSRTSSKPQASSSVRVARYVCLIDAFVHFCRLCLHSMRISITDISLYSMRNPEETRRGLTNINPRRLDSELMDLKGSSQLPKMYQRVSGLLSANTLPDLISQTSDRGNWRNCRDFTKSSRTSARICS